MGFKRKFERRRADFFDTLTGKGTGTGNRYERRGCPHSMTSRFTNQLEFTCNNSFQFKLQNRK